MQPDEILFFKIDDYLHGRLSAADRAAFEADLAADAALAALVQQQRRENMALEVLNERDLRTRMSAWERDLPATPVLQPAGGRYRLRWIGWAAAAVVLLIAGWWFIRPPQPVEAPVAVQPTTPAAPSSKTPTPARPNEKTPRAEPEKDVAKNTPRRETPTPQPALPAPREKTVDYAALADEYYRQSTFFPSNSNSGGTGAASYDRAVQDFKKGKYADLLSQWKRGGKLNTNDLKVKELVAHSLLKSGQYDEAVNAFREIVNTRRQPYADRAEWALALTYLKQMPGKEALLQKSLDRILARPGHGFYGEAKALKGRL
ncbi:MAG: hypothetical protein JNM22_12925 [Saprospiraceae bacterium]|nr:hypothetical protein [Saprospiraceae bacterium]